LVGFRHQRQEGTNQSKKRELTSKREKNFRNLNYHGGTGERRRCKFLVRSTEKDLKDEKDDTLFFDAAQIFTISAHANSFEAVAHHFFEAKSSFQIYLQEKAQ